VSNDVLRPAVYEDRAGPNRAGPGRAGPGRAVLGCRPDDGRRGRADGRTVEDRVDAASPLPLLIDLVKSTQCRRDPDTPTPSDTPLADYHCSNL